MTPLPRGIILAATPLGNIDDATPRLRQALAEADYIAAEDTRRTRNLAQAPWCGVAGSGPVQFRPQRAGPGGTVNSPRPYRYRCRGDRCWHAHRVRPGVSPRCRGPRRGRAITCFPGPSAVPVAIALSGLHVGKFAFDGFAPRKSGVRRAWLESLITEGAGRLLF